MTKRIAISTVPLRHRHDGWTIPRQKAFLYALAETGCLKDACARVGLSKTSAYRLRSKSDAFAQAWDRALGMARPILQAAAFERAVEGVEEPVYQGGKLVGTRRRYSDSIMKTLLDHSERARIRAEAVEEARVAALPKPFVESRMYPGQPEMYGESLKEELERKLMAIHYRLHPENDPKNKKA